MAFSAYLRRKKVEFSVGGTRNIVNPMAIDTGWDIWIAFTYEC